MFFDAMDANYLKTIPMLSGLNAEQINLVRSRCKRVFVPRGSVILNQEDESFDLYIILSGRVKVSLINEDGREITLDILTRGDFFGELSLLDKKPRSATVMALSDATIAVLARETFLKTISEHPDIMLNLLAVMAKRLRKTDEKIETLTFLDVCGRVAKLMIGLAKDEGKALPDGLVKIMSPTHQSIANQIGASREAVTKAIKLLIDRGLIIVKNKEISISPKQF